MTIINPADDICSNQEQLLATNSSKAEQLIKACLRLQQFQLGAANLCVQQEQLQRCILELSDQVIPALMQDLHCQHLTLEGKVDVEIRPIIQASIRSLSSILSIRDEDERAEAMEKRKLALRYLRKQKADALIRQELSILVGKGNQQQAKQIQALCKQLHLPSQLEETVHTQSLARWVRERLEKGLDIDQGALSVYVSSRAILK